jgi:hypothetical protein
MTADRIREVVRIYRQMFCELHRSKPEKCRHNHTPDHAAALFHCHAMLDEIDQFAIEGRVEKAFRWLGFVQGCLWVCGVYSIEELKSHNRTP